jgi:hypothetical protein
MANDTNGANTVDLGQSATITVQPARQVTATSVTVGRIVDNPGEKRVVAFIRELGNPLILWEGAAYDAVGDWTQAQAVAQIKALVLAMH